MKALFELKKSTDGQFLFNLKAPNSEVILTSELYTTKGAAENGIASVRKNAPIAERFEKRVATDNSPYFVLKAANGEIIGQSEMYESEAGRDNGLASVMENGPGASIDDQTDKQYTIEAAEAYPSFNLAHPPLMKDPDVFPPPRTKDQTLGSPFEIQQKDFKGVHDPKYPWVGMVHNSPDQWEAWEKYQKDQRDEVDHYVVVRTRYWKRIGRKAFGAETTSDNTYEVGTTYSHTKTTQNSTTTDIGLELGLNLGGDMFGGGEVPPVGEADIATPAGVNDEEGGGEEGDGENPGGGSDLSANFTAHFSHTLDITTTDEETYQQTRTISTSTVYEANFQYISWQIWEDLAMYRVDTGDTNKEVIAKNSPINRMTSKTSKTYTQAFNMNPSVNNGDGSVDDDFANYQDVTDEDESITAAVKWAESDKSIDWTELARVSEGFADSLTILNDYRRRAVRIALLQKHGRPVSEEVLSDVDANTEEATKAAKQVVDDLSQILRLLAGKLPQSAHDFIGYLSEHPEGAAALRLWFRRVGFSNGEINWLMKDLAAVDHQFFKLLERNGGLDAILDYAYCGKDMARVGFLSVEGPEVPKAVAKTIRYFAAKSVTPCLFHLLPVVGAMAFLADSSKEHEINHPAYVDTLLSAVGSQGYCYRRRNCTQLVKKSAMTKSGCQSLASKESDSKHRQTFYWIPIGAGSGRCQPVSGNLQSPPKK